VSQTDNTSSASGNAIIPQCLRGPAFRFVPFQIKESGAKAPATGTPPEVMRDGYPWDDPVITRCLERGGHAALILGDGRVEADCDVKVGIREDGSNTATYTVVSGAALYEKLCADAGIAVPETFEVSTPSGGKAVIFTQDAAHPLRHGAIGEHRELEIRTGERKYRVVAGPGYVPNDSAMMPAPLRIAVEGQMAAASASPGDGGGDYAQGGENNAMFVAFKALGQIGMNEAEARRALLAFNIALDSPMDEDRLLSTALREGFFGPPEIPPGGMEWAARVTVEGGHAEFWDARPELRYIHDLARARRVSPQAVLGAVLERVIMKVDPKVVLPPLVGSHASLNLFIALTGKPGSGKGGALQVATEVVPEVYTAGLGSGEGLLHQFTHWDAEAKEYVQHRVAAMLTAEEADTVKALKDRSSSTILPTLRSAWMGERLGFAYADPTKRLHLDRHAYRLCMMLGVQPSRAGFLLDDAGAGTPQRILWFSANDPDAPAVQPDEPKPWVWKEWEPARGLVLGGLETLPVCEAIRSEVDADRIARVKGRATQLLEGHAMLAREKAAAALAILAQRTSVGNEDWQLAEVLMSMSRSTRTVVEEAVAEARATESKARGQADGYRSAAAEDVRVRAAIARVAARLLRLLGEGSAARSELRKRVAQRDRQWFDEALQSLIDSGRARRNGSHITAA